MSRENLILVLLTAIVMALIALGGIGHGLDRIADALEQQEQIE